MLTSDNDPATSLLAALRSLLAHYGQEEVEADNALRWISQCLGDATPGGYPLDPPNETPVLIEEPMKRLSPAPTRTAPEAHVNGPDWFPTSDGPRTLQDSTERAERVCYLCSPTIRPKYAPYEPAKHRICTFCRHKLHAISHSFGLGSVVRIDQGGDNTGLKLTLVNQVFDTAKAILHGMSMDRAKARVERNPDLFPEKGEPAPPVDEEAPCERCGEAVPLDEFLGNTRPDGTSEFLCGDCYTPDPSGNFETAESIPTQPVKISWCRVSMHLEGPPGVPLSDNTDDWTAQDVVEGRVTIDDTQTRTRAKRKAEAQKEQDEFVRRHVEAEKRWDSELDLIRQEQPEELPGQTHMFDTDRRRS